MDIMKWKTLSLIYVANMEIIYWSDRSSSRRRGDGEERVWFVSRVTLVRCEFNFIREHKSLGFISFVYSSYFYKLIVDYMLFKGRQSLILIQQF